MPVAPTPGRGRASDRRARFGFELRNDRDLYKAVSHKAADKAKSQRGILGPPPPVGMLMAMHSVRHQGPTPSRATSFCGSLLFLLFSLFLTTNALARDSTGSKADIERGIRTPKIDFIGNRAFSSDKLLKVLLNSKL